MTTRKPHELLNRRFTHEGGVWSGEWSGNEYSDSVDEQRIHQGRASIRRVHISNDESRRYLKLAVIRYQGPQPNVEC